MKLEHRRVVSERTLRLIALGTCMAGAVWAAAAVAEPSGSFDFDQPEQSLAVALRAYAQATHQQILFSEGLVAGRTAPALRGTFTADAALRRLLDGAQLIVERAPSGAVMIMAPGGPGRPAARQSRAAYINPTSASADLPMEAQPALQVAQGPAGPATPAPTAAPALGLEEILVTARRREESLQRVPLAITAVTGQTLKEQEIRSVQDLQYIVPSLNMQTNLGRAVAAGVIRGMRFGTLTYFNQIRADGPYNANNSANFSPPVRYFDLENVQVLKGPQGTLFGGTAMSGAVLMEPAKPKNEFEGYAEAVFGNYKRHDLEGVVNVPIVSDKVLVRVGANVLRRRGITRDVTYNTWVDGSHSEHYRASLTLKPVEGLENRAVFALSQFDEPDVDYKLTYVNPAAFAATLFSTYAAEIARQNALGPYAVAPSARARLDAAFWHVSDILSYELTDTLTVKSIFGWQRVRRRSTFDRDGSTFAGLDLLSTKEDGDPVRMDSKSEEVQLQGNMLDRTLAWTAGYYWYFAEPYGNVGYNVQTALNRTTANKTLNQSKDRAWFLHAQYDLSKLGLEGVKISGGYRQSRSRNSTISSTYLATISPTGGAATRGNCAAAGADAFCRVESAIASKGTGYTFSIDYSLASDKLVYFKTSKAYNPGGINFGVSDLSNPFRQYGPETMRDYEVGLKADWRFAGMQARTNLDLFEAYYGNQVFGTGANINGVVVNVNFNGAKSRTRGIEFEGTLIPVDGLELTTAYAYLMPLYTEILPNNAGITFSSPFPAAPRHKFIGSAKYTLPLDEALGRVSVSGNVTAQSRNATAANFDPYQYIPAVTLVGARIDWRDVMSYPFDLGFSVTNLTNKHYYEGTLPTGGAGSLGFSSVLWSEPRMWRVSLRYRFGALE